MTAICQGGPSEIKPTGIAAQQVLSPDALAELIGGAGFTWFVTAAYAVGYLTFDLTNICAIDPPALPTIDAGRFAGYFNPRNPQGAQQLREDATVIATHILWYLYCQCSSVTTPPIGTALPAPTGVQVDHNSGSQQPTGIACAATGAYAETTTFDANGNHTATLPGNTFAAAPVTWVTVTTAFAYASGGPLPVNATIKWESASGGTILGTSAWLINLSDSVNLSPNQTFQVPAGTNHWSLALHADGGATRAFQYQISVIPYCTSAPLVTQEPCCPPDPLLVTLINQVLQLENLILASLPAGKLPYKDSTVHAGLTGNGKIAVSPASKAIRVDITSRPSPWPSGTTDPNYLFSIGFITPFAVGTALRGSRLVYDHEIFEWPTYTDQIAYALELGVTVQLTELVTGSA